HETIPSDIEIEKYIASHFSDARKSQLEALINDLQEKAEKRAMAVLLQNKTNALVPLSLQLLKLGDMQGEALKEFYLKHTLYARTGNDDAVVKAHKPQEQLDKTKFGA